MMRVHPVHHEAARRAEVRLWSAIALASVGLSTVIGTLIALAFVLWGQS